MWSSKVHRHFMLLNCRNISSSGKINHYDVLGISPKATQAEVKAAYYRLSKLHHPDTSFNKGEDNGDQFRLISEAYEVLGNYRSRQLYDKGLYGHVRRSEVKKDITPDHPNFAFYKSRFVKSRVPTADMGKGVYNFDEWIRQHYSNTFAKSQAAKTSQRNTKSASTNPREVMTDEAMLKLSAALLISFIIGLGIMNIADSAYDSTGRDSGIHDRPT